MSLPFLGSLAGSFGSAAPLLREGARTRPAGNNAADSLSKLTEALEQRLEKVAPNAADVNLAFNPITPKQANAEYLDKLSKPYPPKQAQAIRDFKLPAAVAPFIDSRINGQHATLYPKDSSGKLDLNNPIREQINYNPNADRAVLAHEMGHMVSAKTDVGSKISKLRHILSSNPKLKYSLALATGGLPLGIAALNPGDDEYDEAILGALALNTPTLIDEALATKNAFAMMDTAGMRASLGQRAKLAGGLLSYVAGPMAIATGATAFGNQFDEELPVQ